jgi:predicted nucleic acid-binding protein
MQKIIIADTSCLILLHKIAEFDVLKKLFGEIYITSEISNEFGQSLPSWVIIKNPSNQTALEIINVTVDKGEASAIALALEEDDISLLILDDSKARRLAKSLGLKHTGTLGILIDAKLGGHFQSIKPIIEKVRKTNFFISEELEKRILLLSGEAS